jgi:hypothetical protein
MGELAGLLIHTSSEAGVPHAMDTDANILENR